MNKSESIKELAAALSKAQGAMKNPGFDKTNPHFKSKFASLASVRDSVVPELAKNGISVVQSLEHSEHGIACETMLMHSSGEWLSGTIVLPVSKEDAQGYGSAATYARRYALMSFTMVVGDEDDDGNAASKPQTPAEAMVRANIKPTAGAGDSLSDDDRREAALVASIVLESFRAGDQTLAHANWNSNKTRLSADQQVMAWAKFDSKQRSALTNIETEHRKEHRKASVDAQGAAFINSFKGE